MNKKLTAIKCLVDVFSLYPKGKIRNFVITLLLLCSERQFLKNVLSERLRDFDTAMFL